MGLLHLLGQFQVLPLKGSAGESGDHRLGQRRQPGVDPLPFQGGIALWVGLLPERQEVVVPGSFPGCGARGFPTGAGRPVHQAGVQASQRDPGRFVDQPEPGAGPGDLASRNLIGAPPHIRFSRRERKPGEDRTLQTEEDVLPLLDHQRRPFVLAQPVAPVGFGVQAGASLILPEPVEEPLVSGELAPAHPPAQRDAVAQEGFPHRLDLHVGEHHGLFPLRPDGYGERLGDPADGHVQSLLPRPGHGIVHAGPQQGQQFLHDVAPPVEPGQQLPAAFVPDSLPPLHARPFGPGCDTRMQ